MPSQVGREMFWGQFMSLIPKALIYPLTLAAKSASQSRRAAANHILQNVCEHSNRLVQQARLVSEELIRVVMNVRRA